MKTTFLFFSIVLSVVSCFSQEENCNCPGGHKKGKGTFYFSWGYNKDYFSKSNLHFKNHGSDEYDFTLYNVKAVDRPGFDKILTYMLRGDLAIPQYVYRVGYYFNNKKDLGVEINFDHTKYVMLDYQTARIKGQIRGEQMDKDTLINPAFLRFEHTNGGNFLMFNLLKRQNLFKSDNQKHWLGAIVKPGAGIMIPKTDISLFGTHLDNRFHIAGWLTGVEAGLRYDVKHFFVEPTIKGSFVNYSDVLTIGSGRANHHFWCFEIILSAGFQFGL